MLSDDIPAFVDRKNTVRAILLVIVVSSSLFLTSVYVSAGQADPPAFAPESIDTFRDTSLTVVAGKPTPHVEPIIIVFNDDGERIAQYTPDGNIGDIDPIPGKKYELLYVSTRKYNCPAETECVKNVIGIVNITTGNQREFYTDVDYHNRIADGITTTSHSVTWHDVDHLQGSRYVVADILQDRVFIVNVTSGLIEWEWEVDDDYPVSGGGPYPYDWTHMNDVEILDDGTFMVSLRNQDQVVFLDRKTGLIENRTLGEEDHYETLYEQHNPDYIPREQGGPAIIVADSENNRAIEYQRIDGKWTKSWEWSGPELQWPRDADRLPNGHTLITDSHGNRVFEVDQDGNVVWEADVVRGYDAERLGTGDESTGGPSASRANLSSRVDTQSRETRGFRVIDLIPKKVLHALLFVFPWWMSFNDIVVSIVASMALTTLIVLEFYWRTSLRLRLPVYRE